MEKSIETIWKEGFLKSDMLIAPKLNDLYNKKSTHIVDKFERMFKINLKAIVIGSFVVLALSYIVQIPYMGLGMFLILNGLVVINKKLFKGLEEINKNTSSFQYLKSFDNWMKYQIEANKKISRFLYPLVFLSMCIGFWFGSFGGDIPGENLVNDILTIYPDMILLFGVPAIGLLGMVLITAVLVMSAGRIYQWDFNIVYGRVMKKLNELVADMEELRS